LKPETTINGETMKTEIEWINTDRLSENAWHLAQALQHLEKLHTGDDVRLSPPAKKMMTTFVGHLHQRTLETTAPEHTTHGDSPCP